MARARNIKPGFFKNEYLVDLPPITRLLFIGLWCLADREGRFEDRPRRIKIELFPADDIDIDAALADLERSEFIIRYEANGIRYAQITNFTKHQVPHHKEVASEIPAPPGKQQVTKHPYDVSDKTRSQVFNRDGNSCLRCGSKESLSIDHIKPLVHGGDNSINNLQTLCKSCNSIKGTSITDFRKSNNKSKLNQHDSNVGSTLSQQRINHNASCPSDSLIPDSLIPESRDTVLTHTDYPSQQSNEPTPAASVCMEIKRIGIVDVNPSHPKLLMLIESGATIDEFMHAARTAKGKSKGFRYVLGIVEGQRTEAESAKENVLQGKIPNKADMLLQSNKQAVSDWKPPEMRVSNDGT